MVWAPIQKYGKECSSRWKNYSRFTEDYVQESRNWNRGIVFLNMQRTPASSEQGLGGKLFVHFIALIYLSYIKKTDAGERSSQEAHAPKFIK